MTETESFIWKVKGMTCNGCKMSIEKMLSRLEGVAGVTVDFSESTLRLELDLARLRPQDIEKAVENIGFELEATRNSN